MILNTAMTMKTVWSSHGDLGYEEDSLTLITYLLVLSDVDMLFTVQCICRVLVCLVLDFCQN